MDLFGRRRSTPSTSSGHTSTARTHTYSAPFPVPTYLQHSTYAPRFFTTTPEPSLFGGSTSQQQELSAALDSSAASEQASILLPTCWDEGDKCNLIDLSTDGLTANFAGSAKYGDRDAAAVRSNRPVPPQAGVYYYEVTITDKGLSGYIGIGFSHRDVKLSRLPGWEADSWGYHGDDGRAFCCLGTGESFGPTFTTGDVVGCGVDYTDAGPPVGTGKEKSSAGAGGRKGREVEAEHGGRVFFTKNGDMLGYAFSNVHGKLYPSVGLRTPGEIVRANFGSEPFKFDIDSLTRDRHRTILSRISDTSIPSSVLLPSPSPSIPALLPTSTSERTHETLQSLVTSYLLHHGYSSTAESFSRQVVEERRERAKGLVPSPIAGVAGINLKTKVEDEEQLKGVMSAGDGAIVRGQVRERFLLGDVEGVREVLGRSYPALLEEQQGQRDPKGGLNFRLRLREFVEAVLRVGREAAVPTGEGDVKGKGKLSPTSEASDDVDMDSTSFSSTSNASLDHLLALGRALHADYSTDPRPAVQEALQRTFSLMAYDSPEALKGAPREVRELVGERERERLMDEVNGAILVAQSLPPIPHLEALYRHTAATIRLLGDVGVGGAALVDLREGLGLSSSRGGRGSKGRQ